MLSKRFAVMNCSLYFIRNHDKFATNGFSVRERLDSNVLYSFDYNIQYIVELFYIGNRRRFVSIYASRPHVPTGVGENYFHVCAANAHLHGNSPISTELQTLWSVERTRPLERLGIYFEIPTYDPCIEYLAVDSVSRFFPCQFFPRNF